jgi:hypothetical protein
MEMTRFAIHVHAPFPNSTLSIANRTHQSQIIMRPITHISITNHSASSQATNSLKHVVPRKFRLCALFATITRTLIKGLTYSPALAVVRKPLRAGCSRSISPGLGISVGSKPRAVGLAGTRYG